MDLEHEKRLTAVEGRAEANSYRLDKMEERQEALQDLVSSVKLLAAREEKVEIDVKEIKANVKTLADKPAKRWEKLIEQFVITFAAAILGFILAKIGL